ncbi:MAG TPA: hypothetical protein VMW56_02400 [Candidatus Margulisiibacteriota bacterium]|nr:hypothetical protein [Candidatus Margulisiibacteriota bacterium]
MLGLRRKDDALFTPRMPEVEEPDTLAAVFDQARSTAAARPATGGARPRCVVIVTPGRLLLLQPSPPAGSMPESQAAGIKKLISPEPQRNIAAISYTDLAALKANIAKAIPFVGILLGFAYIGHAVWVFEGHASALAHGCRNADVLLVDSGMLPHLPPNWRAVAGSAMQRPEIYVHDRATFRLSPATRVVAA